MLTHVCKCVKDVMRCPDFTDIECMTQICLQMLRREPVDVIIE